MIIREDNKDLITRSEIVELSGGYRGKIYTITKTGLYHFPKPVCIKKQTYYYQRSEVLQWLKEHDLDSLLNRDSVLESSTVTSSIDNKMAQDFIFKKSGFHYG